MLGRINRKFGRAAQPGNLNDSFGGVVEDPLLDPGVELDCPIKGSLLPDHDSQIMDDVPASEN